MMVLTPGLPGAKDGKINGFGEEHSGFGVLGTPESLEDYFRCFKLL